MSSGQTLIEFTAKDFEPPSSAYAQPKRRNGHRVLAFDTTTQEGAYFEGILPRSYGGGGLTVYLHWAADTAITGTGGWVVAFETLSGQDIDSDGFASDQTITAATVNGTAGIESVTSVAITSGANMDSLAAGGAFRLRVRRDVANDNAAGDLHLMSIEIKET